MSYEKLIGKVFYFYCEFSDFDLQSLGFYLFDFDALRVDDLRN
jgi:hypothetical protein